MSLRNVPIDIIARLPQGYGKLIIATGADLKISKAMHPHFHFPIKADVTPALKKSLLR